MRRVFSPGTDSPHDDLDRHMRAALARLDEQADRPTGPPELLPIFDAMAGSRVLDIQARRMRERGRGVYTIGSAGHESNAFVAAALRPTDPALLHYRSGGFFLARALQAGRPLDDALRAVLLGMLASADDPASGGPAQGVRRRRAGRDPADLDHRLTPAARARGRAGRRPGQAAGGAVALAGRRRHRLLLRRRQHQPLHRGGRAQRRRLRRRAGAAAAAAVRVRGQRAGISVPTPQGWVARAAQRPGIHYLAPDGADPDATRAAAGAAVERARRTRTPVFLHLRCVRFLSHAGSDVETAYRTAAAITTDAPTKSWS
jgi:2-oxoisovalerate dehydrogenase E1 component